MLLLLIIISLLIFYIYTELEIGFINAPYSANETDGFVTFEVGVTNGVQLGQEVSVEFSTVDISGILASNMAIASEDYNAIIGQTLTFGPGNTRTTVDVVVNDDGVFELSEQFGGSLTSSAVLERFTLGPDFASATIFDNDGKKDLT